jgi:hypothetical protein
MRSLPTLILVIHLASLANGQPADIPLSEVWRHQADTALTGVSDVWETDGHIQCLVASSDGAYILTDGEISWHSNEVQRIGAVKASARIVFEDEVVIVACTINPPGARLHMFSGEGFRTYSSGAFGNYTPGDNHLRQVDCLARQILINPNRREDEHSVVICCDYEYLETDGQYNYWHEISGYVWYFSLDEMRSVLYGEVTYRTGRAINADFDNDGRIETIISGFIDFENYDRWGNGGLTRKVGCKIHVLNQETNEIIWFDGQDRYHNLGSISYCYINNNIKALVSVHDSQSWAFGVSNLDGQFDNFHPTQFGFWSTISHLNQDGTRYFIGIGPRPQIAVLESERYSVVGIDSLDETPPISIHPVDERASQVIICTQRKVFLYDLEDLAVALPNPPTPNQFSLSAFPNPFNSSTTIRFSTGSQAAPTRLAVYGIDGRLVKEFDGKWKMENGTEHSVVWEAGDLPGGIYLIRLEGGGEVKTIKSVLLK